MKFANLFFFLIPMIGWAQDPVIRLELQSDLGPVEVLVGNALSRDGETGAFHLSGGVQIRQDDGGLLVADDVVATPHTSSMGKGLTDLGQLNEVLLRGRAFIQSAGIEVQADTLSLTQSLRLFSSKDGPASLIVGEQTFDADGGAIGDLSRQIFYGYGGVRVQADNFYLEGDQVQISLPQLEGSQAPAQLLAQGRVHLRGQGITITAERAETGPEGQILYLSGGVTIDSGTGELEARSVQFDLETQEFALSSVPSNPEPMQEFLSL